MKKAIMTAFVIAAFNVAVANAAEDFIYFSTVKVAAGKMDRFKQLFLPYVDDTRNEKDGDRQNSVIEYRVYSSPTDAQDLLIFEHWRSQADYLAHKELPHTTDFNATVGKEQLLVESFPFHQKGVLLK